LPEGTIVINTGRGNVLDLDALGAALDSGHLHAAGLDVVFPEPLPDGHPLLANPKVTFSPHIAGSTVETNFQLARSAVDQIFACLQGTMPTSPVNPAAWERPQSRRPNGDAAFARRTT